MVEAGTTGLHTAHELSNRSVLRLNMGLSQPADDVALSQKQIVSIKVAPLLGEWLVYNYNVGPPL